MKIFSENFKIFWQNHPKLKQISSLGSEIVKIFACGALKSSTYQWKLIIFDEFGTKCAPERCEIFWGLKNLHFAKTNKKTLTKGSHPNAYENLFDFNQKVSPEAIQISRSASCASSDAVMSTVLDPARNCSFSVGKISHNELFRVTDAPNFGVHDDPQWGSLGFIMNPKVIFGSPKSSDLDDSRLFRSFT